MLCPRCCYDLTGLPEIHKCPECGCPYDAHSIGIGFSGRRNQYLGLALWIPLVPIVVWLRGARLFTIDSFRVLGPFVVVAIVTIVYTLQRGGLPTRLILHREGVELVTPGQMPLAWAWHDLSEAGLSSFTGRFKIVGKDGKVLYAGLYGRLGKFRVAERCAAEINARVARYAGDDQRPT